MSDDIEEMKRLRDFLAKHHITKRFERVEITKRGKLLLNAITSDIESMGHSISEQEKRQILMEVLKKLC